MSLHCVANGETVQPVKLNAYQSQIQMMVGTFRLFAQFHDPDDHSKLCIVIRDSIDVQSDTTIVIRESEACYDVVVRPVDENGQCLDFFKSTENGSIYRNYLLVWGENNPEQAIFYGGISEYRYNNYFKISGFSHYFKIGFEALSFNDYRAKDPVIRLIRLGPITEINHSQVFSNQPRQLTSARVRFTSPIESNVRVGGYLSSIYKGNGGVLSLSLPVFTDNTSHYQLDLFLEDEYDDVFSQCLQFNYYPIDRTGTWVDYRVPPLRVENGQVGLYGSAVPSVADCLFEDGDVIEFGSGPFFISAFLYVNTNLGMYFRFVGSLNERYNSSKDLQRVRVYNGADSLLYDENPIKQEVHLNAEFEDFKTEIQFSGYQIQDKRGCGTLRSWFSKRHADTVPPLFTSLGYRNSEGAPLGRQIKDNHFTLRFSASDYFQCSSSWDYLPVISDSSKVWIRVHGEAAWQEINCITVAHDTLEPHFIDFYVYSSRLVNSKGMVFDAEVQTESTQPTLLDLKISILDGAGNRSEWEMTPAVLLNAEADEPESHKTVDFQYLQQNFPNPFTGSTRISFYLPEKAPVSLSVYNVRGQRVALLIDENLPMGLHDYTWVKSDLATGTYFIKLKVDSHVETRKCTVL